MHGDMLRLNEARHGPIKAGTVPLDGEAEAPWIQDQLSWRSEARKDTAQAARGGGGGTGLRGIVRFCSVPGSRPYPVGMGYPGSTRADLAIRDSWADRREDQ